MLTHFTSPTRRTVRTCRREIDHGGYYKIVASYNVNDAKFKYRPSLPPPTVAMDLTWLYNLIDCRNNITWVFSIDLKITH